ncbi:MAG: nucleoside hydrolase [Clostridia bacterium]|nr:nucleoside hydrolase [Clostridia bacterium]
MRKLWIDTDTASDDAVALLMALREPSVQVLGISVVMGNVSLEQAVKNALISVERAGTYAPPVYAGASKPLYRSTDFAVVCHGVDGLSDRGYPDAKLQAKGQNAMEAMLRCARENPGEVELVTLGPLTNVAAAAFMDPEGFKLFKSITIMGGALRMPGNWSPVAEFNIIIDPEAAEAVFHAGVPVILAPFEICTGDSLFAQEDRDRLAAASPTGAFAVDCNLVLIEYGKRLGLNGLCLADPAAMAVVLWPQIVQEKQETYLCVETAGKYTTGMVIYDYIDHLHRPKNGTVIQRIDGKAFKERTIRCLS